jgi:hypothetical protein
MATSALKAVTYKVPAYARDDVTPHLFRARYQGLAISAFYKFRKYETEN